MQTLPVKAEVAPHEDLIYLRQWTPDGSDALRVMCSLSFDQARELVDGLQALLITFDVPRVTR